MARSGADLQVKKVCTSQVLRGLNVSSKMKRCNTAEFIKNFRIVSRAGSVTSLNWTVHIGEQFIETRSIDRGSNPEW